MKAFNKNIVDEFSGQRLVKVGGPFERRDAAGCLPPPAPSRVSRGWRRWPT
jgi:hypothetical protein